MQEENVVENILKIYKNSENICDIFDNMVEREALNSFYYSAGQIKDNGTMAVSDRIIKLIEKKKLLINLKVAIDNLFSSITFKEKELLKKRFFTNLTAEEIALQEKYSLRTYFRRLKECEEKILKYLAMLNIDDEQVSQIIEISSII